MTLALVGALVAVPVSANAARTRQSAEAGDVFYSPKATAPQAKSPSSMRTFLSTNHPEFNLQSYVWAGSLVDEIGTVNTFGIEMQRNGESFDGTAQLPFVSAGALFNQSKDPGYAVGGLSGIADLTLPLSLTTQPWSARAQSFTPGQLPNFIDARVVEGAFGTPGAVYEFTALVPNLAIGAPADEFLTLYVRVKDHTGIMQWGYGPSGFFPQWIYPDQRAAIIKDSGSSVGKYLSATHDPMTNQGDYYYSLPLLQVERFSVSLKGQVVSKGSTGWIWFDNVTQQMDAQAESVVSNGVTWLEFSVQIPKSKQAMKIGHVEQASVGTLSYAMLHDSDAPKAQNGASTNSLNWDMNKVHITPIASSLWKSPVSGNSYYTKFRVNLGGSKAGRRAHLVIKATFDAQEVNVPGRSVYEGLFTVTGTLRGKKVTGQAWAEIQAAGSL